MPPTTPTPPALDFLEGRTMNKRKEVMRDTDNPTATVAASPAERYVEFDGVAYLVINTGYAGDDFAVGLAEDGKTLFATAELSDEMLLGILRFGSEMEHRGRAKQKADIREALGIANKASAEGTVLGQEAEEAALRTTNAAASVPAGKVYDALMRVNPDRDWPDVDGIERWSADEREAVYAWAETGLNDDEFPEPLASYVRIEESLPGRLKAEIFAEPGLTGRELLFGVCPGELDKNAMDVERSLWALLHLGEIDHDPPWVDADTFVALTWRTNEPRLSVDVDARLAEHPELGTEAGLPADEIARIKGIVERAIAGVEPEEEAAVPLTSLEYAVVRMVKRRREGATKREIRIAFSTESPPLVDLAIEVLMRGNVMTFEAERYHVLRGDPVPLDLLSLEALQAVEALVFECPFPSNATPEKLRERIRGEAPGLTLDDLGPFELRPIYRELHDGMSPGGVTAKTMRGTIHLRATELGAEGERDAKPVETVEAPEDAASEPEEA